MTFHDIYHLYPFDNELRSNAGCFRLSLKISYIRPTRATMNITCFLVFLNSTHNRKGHPSDLLSEKCPHHSIHYLSTASLPPESDHPPSADSVPHVRHTHKPR